jgi:hypothetical protein
VHASLDNLRREEEQAKATMAGGGGGAQDLASIQKVVDALPELNRQKREVAKHVAICSDLSKRASHMFAVSEVQQELLMAAVLPSAPLPDALFQQGTSSPPCIFSSMRRFFIARVMQLPPPCQAKRRQRWTE